MQILSRVDTAEFELGVQCGHLDNACDVAARADGQIHVWDIDSEVIRIPLIQTQTVDLAGFFPDLQRDCQIDTLFGADGGDPEQRGDIDDSDAAHLHEVAGDGFAGTEEFFAVGQREANDVVANEAVAAF